MRLPAFLSLSGSDAMSRIILKNLLFSLFLKIGTALVGLALVPAALRLIGVEGYGIWLTLSSLTGSLFILDFGLANGFRNKFTAALTLNDQTQARAYVSGVTMLMLLVAVLLLVLFSLSFTFINWPQVLHLSQYSSSMVTAVWCVMFLFFAIRLVVSVVNTILIAAHLVAWSNLMEFLITGLSFVMLIAFPEQLKGSVLGVSMVLGGMPIVVFTLFGILLFVGKFKAYRPSFSWANFETGKSLMQIGAQFFLIQLTSVLLFTAGSFLVNAEFGPSVTATFGVVNKYYSIPLMAFGFVITPFWSGFTDAYVRNDLAWISKSIKRLVMVWLMLVLGLIVMVVFREFLCRLWLRETYLSFDRSTAWLGAFFVLITTWNNIFSFFLNGIGKIRVQLIGSVFLVILIVPLIQLLCGTFNMGVNGVFLAFDLCLLPGAILGPLQFFLIIKGKARGIWLR